MVFNKKNTNESIYTHTYTHKIAKWWPLEKKKKGKNLARKKNNFLLLLFCENTAKQLLWHGFLFDHMLLLLLFLCYCCCLHMDERMNVYNTVYVCTLRIPKKYGVAKSMFLSFWLSLEFPFLHIFIVLKA